MPCFRSIVLAHACLLAVSLSPLTVMGQADWNTPSAFRPSSPQNDMLFPDMLAKRMMGQLDAAEAEIRGSKGDNSPELLRQQMYRVYVLLNMGRLEEAAEQLDQLRRKTMPILEDGRPAAEQSDMLKGLRSTLMNLDEELALRRGEYDAVIQSGTEHLKLLAGMKDPKARGRMMRTILFLVEALKMKQRAGECTPLVKHAIDLMKSPDVPSSEMLAGDLSLLAAQAKSLRLSDEAGILGDKAVKMIEQMLVADRNTQVFGLAQIAHVQMEQNKLPEAETALVKAIAAAEEQSADPLLLIDLLNSLGRVKEGLYKTQGDKQNLEQAERNYQLALVLARKENPPSPIAIAIGLGNLAGVEELRGEVAKAVELRKQAWDALEKTEGPDSEKTLLALAAYTQAVEFQGKVPEALELYKKLLTRAQTTLGALHPKVAEVHQLMGRAYMQAKRWDEAEKSYERAAAIRERTLGAEHADTAKSYFNVGLAREAKGDYAGATAYFDHVLKIDRKAHGNGSEAVAEDITALARVLMLDGRKDEAAARLNEHIAWIEEHLGRDHSLLSIPFLALANVEEQREKFAEAEAFYLHVIELRVKALGEDHNMVADAHGRYAMFLIARNKLTLAADELRTAAANFARHHLRNGTQEANLRTCIDIYVSVLRKLQVDPHTIESHVRSLEKGVDPVQEGKKSNA
ncbi:MAG: tetratricopeptide repeat protein [Verrucomicrobiaceae bacterium]